MMSPSPFSLSPASRDKLRGRVRQLCMEKRNPAQRATRVNPFPILDCLDGSKAYSNMTIDTVQTQQTHDPGCKTKKAATQNKHPLENVDENLLTAMMDMKIQEIETLVDNGETTIEDVVESFFKASL